MSTDDVKEQVKANLLDHYSRRDPTNFFQYDFFEDVEADAVMLPDEDGDSLFSTFTTELMTGNPAVRILITEGVDHQAVVRGLRKLLAIIEDETDWPPWRFNTDVTVDESYARGMGGMGLFTRIDPPSSLLDEAQPAR